MKRIRAIKLFRLSLKWRGVWHFRRLILTDPDEALQEAARFADGTPT